MIKLKGVPMGRSKKSKLQLQLLTLQDKLIKCNGGIGCNARCPNNKETCKDYQCFKILLKEYDSMLELE